MDFLLIVCVVAASPWLARLFLRGWRRLLKDAWAPSPAFVLGEPDSGPKTGAFRTVFNGDHYKVQRLGRDPRGRMGQWVFVDGAGWSKWDTHHLYAAPGTFNVAEFPDEKSAATGCAAARAAHDARVSHACPDWRVVEPGAGEEAGDA